MFNLLSQNEFARCALEHFLEPVVDGKLQVDSQKFALEIVNDRGVLVQQIQLERFYRQYRAFPEELEAILRRVASFARERPDISDYQLIAPSLMPVIADRAGFELTWRQGIRDYGPEIVGPGLRFLICDYFVLYPVIETETKLMRIPYQCFDEWSSNFEQVFERAGQNLINESGPQMFEQLFDKKTGALIYRSGWRDGFDAIRVFYEDMSKLKVNGERLFLLLDEGCVLIWGSKDEIGTQNVLSKLEQSENENNGIFRALPPFVLHQKNGEFRVYNPDPFKEATLYWGFRKFQLDYLAKAYNRQFTVVSRDPEVVRNSTYLSEFIVENGVRPSSTCIWKEGETCLLPKTDTVLFMRSCEGSVRLIARASWETVCTNLPDLIFKEDCFPHLFSTVGFPTETQLAQFDSSYAKREQNLYGLT